MRQMKSYTNPHGKHERRQSRSEYSTVNVSGQVDRKICGDDVDEV